VITGLFDLIAGAWLMQFEHGWYAYRDDQIGQVRSGARPKQRVLV
jgi:hypothetical protein